jgi:hypothetical protein
MSVALDLSGSGDVGRVAAGWLIREEATPFAPGDTRGAVSSAKIAAARTDTSIFARDNDAAFETEAGVFRGRVSEVATVGLAVTLAIAGGLGFLVTDRTMPPVWFDDSNDFLGYVYGAGAGEVGSVYGIAVDPVDGGILVGSNGTVNGADRYKVIKFDSSGTYVTEFGSSGSGNGQFGGAISVAVSPVDQSVWVGDGVNKRITKFTTADGGLTYAYSTKVGSDGTGNGQFSAQTPIVVAVDGAGNVYATDRGNTRIQKFNSSAVYQAQVSTGGTAQASPYGLSVSPSGEVWTSVLDTAWLTSSTPATMKAYNSSLVLQTTLTIPAPSNTVLGIGNFGFDAAGDFWAQWFNATYLVKYDTSGAELTRWISDYPASTDINTNYNLAVGAAGVFVLFRPTTVFNTTNPYDGNYVVGFDYAPVPLSSAILRYMEACDSNLNGYTFDYQCAADPDVVFPGWKGNVWAKLKELCCAYSVELALVDDVIVVRDVASTEITIENHSLITVKPTSGPFSGRAVEVMVQNPVAGGGVMWDAATEEKSFYIEAGKSASITLTTNNHPVSVASPVKTEVLPIQPGQFYVVDSTGSAVPGSAWTGTVRASVGADPGTIVLDITGPPSAPAGFTGPFYFANGRGPGSSPALSIVGPGVMTTPTLQTIPTGGTGSQEVAVRINSPFIDTLERAYDRGIWSSVLAGAGTVVATFDIATASLPGLGLTCGARFRHLDSMYRITSVEWGAVRSRVEAEWYVTVGDFDQSWAGHTVGDFDALWSGYSTGDVNLMPLRT